MKKLTNALKIFCVLALFTVTQSMKSQCAVNFSYTLSPGGFVNFAAVATPTPNQLYWVFGNGSTYSTIQPTLQLTASAQYTANGTYTITLYANGSCSATSIQTINISSSTVCVLSASVTPSIANNGAVSFSNNTTGQVSGTTYAWNYGDGSTGSSFAHTYTANGVYTATVVATNNPGCVSTFTTTFTVNTVCSTPIIPSYTVSQSAGNLTLTSTSTGTNGSTTYDWHLYLGNNTYSVVTGSSPEASASYSVNGSYVTWLNVYNSAPSCTAFTSQTITINTATVCTLNADFATSQSAGSVVNFYNTSTGTAPGTTYSWNYGDGNTGTGASPAHTYSANGTYTIILSANNNFTPACVSTKTVVLVVNSGCNLVAGFTYSLGANGSVSFGNTSTGSATSTAYAWNFGDGGTNSSYTPAPHTYFNGTYTVSLTITSTSTWMPPCSNTATMSITVTSNTCVANSGFSMVPSGTPQFWYAVVSSTTGVASALWSWGDGTTSNTLMSSHSYSAAGNYSICLTVTMSCGAISTSCYTYNISKSNAGGIIYVEAITADQAGATGINNASADLLGYSISPNPSNGSFKLNVSGLSAAKATINVYSLVGTLVYSGENEVANGTLVKDINLETISGGVYFIKISSDNKEYTKKLIINK